MDRVGIIPAPVEMEESMSSFAFTDGTKIFHNFGADGEEMAAMANELLGKSMSVVEKRPSKNVVALVIDTTFAHNEGYELFVDKNGMEIKAKWPAGILYGLQTLRQMYMQRQVDTTTGTNKEAIPAGRILDYPRFGYRGMMLDIARHFFSPDDIKSLIDKMALYKMNHLHLHLTDDQGWRIEIKSWPKLTTVGGKTEVGGGEGGYLTQEDYLDIQAYAQKRNITIVPEIDMPGHTHAALVSYPELACDTEKREHYTGMRVGFSTLCWKKDVVYQFVDDVIMELADLTTGPYIHIGGDESQVTPMEAYIPFIERAKSIVNKYGKTVVGWDEIAHAKLDNNDVVQWWNNEKNTLMGVEQGTKVIISPAKRIYLDMKYNEDTKLGLKWSGLIEVDKAYNWTLRDLAPNIPESSVLGIESPLWAETTETIDDVEFLVFPRLCGVAEKAWSKEKLKMDWDEYSGRLKMHYPILDKLDVNYYKSPLLD